MLSLVLSVSLLVTTLVTPVAAAGQEPEETAAEELLSALKDYFTSSKEEAAEEPAPEETENTALPAEDTVDETPYTSKDVKTREGGFLYNAAGDVIGVECTVEVETTEGTKTQTIDKYYTYVADGAVCAACGGVYCAEHDFTNGFCDACGRDMPGKAPVCTDGNMDGTAEYLR